jgi:hypothetical protein
MAAPEWNILNRTRLILESMAATRQFTASQGEVVRPVPPNAIRVWKAVEQGRGENGIQNIALPAIRITSLPVESTIGAGLNCADDEVVRIAIQILDVSNYDSSGPLRTYMDWMDLIRTELLAVPNPFLQDADVEVYDPFVVHIIKRLSAEAQSLVRHEQQVALFTFQVMVRHHR